MFRKILAASAVATLGVALWMNAGRADITLVPVVKVHAQGEVWCAVTIASPGLRARAAPGPRGGRRLGGQCRTS